VKVSVIVLNWNGRDMLAGCLGSLALQTFRDFEVILADNGSSDGSAEYVRERFPWVRLLALETNAGFSGGNNRALSLCKGELIVTLNNDTEAEPDFLTELSAAADRDPGVGMVAALLVNFFTPGILDAAGIAPGFDGLGYCLGHGEPVAVPRGEPAEIFGPSAGAALYRRSMLEEVGFFDNNFFAYYEDLDLAWRGRHSGWRCVTAPHAVVRHMHSATSGKTTPFTIYHLHRNKWYVLLKNWPMRLLLRHLPRILFTDLAAFSLAAMKGRGGAAFRARLAVLAALPRLLTERRKLCAHDRFFQPERYFIQRKVISLLKRKLGLPGMPELKR
jgi:GT2 family glycosyltransferase